MQETPSHFEPQGSPSFHVDGVFLNCFCTNNTMSTEHTEMHDHPFISNINTVKKKVTKKIQLLSDTNDWVSRDQYRQSSPSPLSVNPAAITKEESEAMMKRRET